MKEKFRNQIIVSQFSLVEVLTKHRKMGDAKTFASCNFYDVLNAKLLWHLIATDNDVVPRAVLLSRLGMPIRMVI